jgi:hypothetical protein
MQRVEYFVCDPLCKGEVLLIQNEDLIIEWPVSDKYGIVDDIKLKRLGHHPFEEDEEYRI